MSRVGAGEALQGVAYCNIDFLFGFSTRRYADAERENKQPYQRDYDILAQHDCSLSC